MPRTPLDAIAVVTVAYNSGTHLRSFLASVRASETAPVRVVVADNGSSDLETLRAACTEFGATLLELGENHGYGGAINRAVATLADDVDAILISNPDVVFEPAAISALAEALEARPQTGAVGPRVLNADGSLYPSARRLPSLRTGIGHALFSRVWRGNPWTARYLSDSTATGVERDAGWLSGACLLVRRKAFDAVKGFDEGFFMYFEDVDLGYRIGKAGWRNTYLPYAVVTHTGAHSTSTESARMIDAHHRSAFRYLSNKYRGWYLAPLRWVLGAGLRVRARWLSLRR